MKGQQKSRGRSGAFSKKGKASYARLATFFKTVANVLIAAPVSAVGSALLVKTPVSVIDSNLCILVALIALLNYLLGIYYQDRADNYRPKKGR